MPELFGHTRARIAARHALITPDNHVNSTFPGIAGATAIVLINEAMGANFAQTLVTFRSEGRATFRQPEIQTFGYVLRGAVTVRLPGNRQRCGEGGYFFAPAGQVCELSAPRAGTQVMLFQKRYVPTPNAPTPPPILGDAAKVKGTAFLGDPAANLQVLLPDEPAFDMAVNVFAYQPGGHLPARSDGDRRGGQVARAA